MVTIKNNFKVFGIAISAILFSLTACSSSSLSLEEYKTDPDNPNLTPTANKAIIFTTTANGADMLYQSSADIYTGSNMAPTTIRIDPSKTYQTMDGFGFAITYSSCYNLLHMTAEDRAAFLKRTYSTTEGFGTSYARISIGCNDFSSTEYTLCDKKGLENFAFYKDETDYVIPILKEILAINPNVKIIAAPWTCPKWMKVKNLWSKTPHDSWTDGHINPSYYQTYADYFVKFIQGMKNNGIDIYAVSPQNEPLNKGNCASTYIPWKEEADFVKVLAATFKKNSLKTKIYLFDHNFNYENSFTQNDYPIKIYNALGDSYEGSEYVVGAAYHNYGGNPEELDDVHAKAPTKELIFSETSIGTWNDGRNLTARLLNDMRDVTFATVTRYCKAVLVWNLMLDKNMGPNLDGGCQTCFGAVDIDQNGYKQLHYNSHYFIICHMSSVVNPVAVRIGVTSDSTQLSDFSHVEFLNPDGTKAVIMLNTGDTDRNVTISDGQNHFRCRVPAGSVVSCKWDK